MIVLSMNTAEIITEIVADYPVVKRKSGYLLDSLRREALKTGKVVERFFEYVSPRKNTWVIFCRYYKKYPIYFSTVYFNNHVGLTAISVYEKPFRLLHYTTHFIEQYRDRFIKDLALPKIDTLKRFLPLNCISSVDYVEESEDFYIKFKDGVGFGVEEDFEEDNGLQYTIAHLKTFITDDMVFDEQEDIKSVMNQYNAFCGTFRRKHDPIKASL